MLFPILGKLATTLKPGGIIAIETPDTDGYDRYFFSRGTWGGYYVPRHLNLYNFERLARLLTRSGLEIVRQKSLPAPIIWCYSLQAVLQEQFGSKTGIARLFDLRIRHCVATDIFLAMPPERFHVASLAVENRALTALRLRGEFFVTW